MPRPSPEELYHTYNEVYTASNGQGNGNYPFLLRDFIRTYSSGYSPNYPRTLLYNPLTVDYSKALTRTFATLYRHYTPPGTSWDRIVFTYRGPTFVQPGGGLYTMGTVSHNALVRDAVINKAMDKVHDRKVNVAQFIAERRQLANTVQDVVNRLTKAIQGVRRGNVKAVQKALGLSKAPKKFSGNVANDWLAVQYGWKPLLSDVKGAAEHLAQKDLSRGSKRVLVKVRHQLPIPSQSLVGGVLGLSNCVNWKWDEGLTQGYCRLEFALTNDFLREGTQLGLTDPLTLAWELVPWSFVVDWFIPIGNFLGRLNYDSGLTFIGGSTTLHSVQHSEVATLASVQVLSGNQTNELSASTVVTFKAMKVNREVHLFAPQPVFPMFKDPFSPTHALNALALMRKAFGR